MNRIPLDIQFFATPEVSINKITIAKDNETIDSVKVTLTCESGIMAVDNADGEIDNDWVRHTDYTATKTYTTNTTETITVTTGTSSTDIESVPVTLSITEIGTAVDVLYAFCGSKCKHQIPKIWHGTTVPSNDLGVDGDIYLQHN